MFVFENFLRSLGYQVHTALEAYRIKQLPLEKREAARSKLLREGFSYKLPQDQVRIPCFLPARTDPMRIVEYAGGCCKPPACAHQTPLLSAGAHVPGCPGRLQVLQHACPPAKGVTGWGADVDGFRKLGGDRTGTADGGLRMLWRWPRRSPWALVPGCAGLRIRRPGDKMVARTVQCGRWSGQGHLAIRVVT